MIVWASLTLNLLLALLYGLAIMPSIRLSRNTMDPGIRRIRLITAAISAGFFLLTLVLFLQRAETHGLLPAPFGRWLMEPLVIDAILVYNICVVSMQLRGAKGKIGSLTGVFNEIHRLRREATLDELTGLYNRHVLSRIVENVEWTDWCVLMIDIDDFKGVNDLLGHAHGDKVLKRVAECVLGHVRSTDMAFRYGGEEIVVICPFTPLEEGRGIAERIRRAVDESTQALGGVTVSIGMDTGLLREGLDRSMENADKALYMAKAQGKNRVVDGGTAARTTTALPTGA